MHALASGWFTNTYSGSYCISGLTYSLTKSNSAHSTNAQVDSTSGEFKVDTSTIHSSSNYDFRVNWNSQEGESSSFQITTSCCSSSQVLTQPTLVSYQEYYINDYYANFEFDAFTQASSTCPIEGTYPYSWYTSTSAGTLANTWAHYAVYREGRWTLFLAYSYRNIE